MHSRKIATACAVFAVSAVFTTSAGSAPAVQSAPRVAAQRKPFFGDLHLHTTFSFDSNAMLDNREVTPDLAYQFARGLPVTIFGRRIQRGRALDFLAVTDHTENLGLAYSLKDPASPLQQTEVARLLREVKDDGDAGYRATVEAYKREVDHGTFVKSWAEEIAAANRNYKPGEFTTFIGYEWASETLTNADPHPIHRNVIFSGANAPLPFTTFDSKDPEDLWTYLERSRAEYGDVLAIVNHPLGTPAFRLTTFAGKPFERAYADRRLLNEPLAEIANGADDHDSSVEASPQDRWLAFRFEDPKAVTGGVREALSQGLKVQARLGVNPFQFGVVGTSDNHTGLTSEEPLIIAPKPFSGAAFTFDSTYSSLTGVWAEENSRESIFAALRRREVFATSGPHIQLRFFGGWNYLSSLLSKRDWPERAYAQGTPMGGRLGPRPLGATSPRFIIWAQHAPEGAPLARAQVIKLSLSGDRYHEQLYDVALKPNRRGSDFVLVWEDPAFDPRSPAVYYLRVLEVETPRRRTLFGTDGRLIPGDWPATSQERAWSSPIWYVSDP
jgi:hypothetical protein